MTREEALRLLEERNPFASASAGDPWETAYPDVSSINDFAFRGLSRLVAQKARDPALNCAALVLGEAGTGKTHLIGRLLRNGRRSDQSFSFAYIQPIEDPEQTFRYLLREVAVNLCRPEEGDSSIAQLDRLLAAVLADSIEAACLEEEYDPCPRVLARLRQDPFCIFRTIAKPSTFAKFQKCFLPRARRRYPGIPKDFLKVLFQWRDPSKRAAAGDWLKGRVIDEEDARLLGVPDRLQATPAALESEARDILDALGELLGRYGMPMLVCFDRLENLETDEQLRALQKMAEFLVDKARAMLPVAFARGQEWQERFSFRLNRHILGRFESNRFELEDCRSEEALEIVRSRLASVLGESPEDPLFPLDRQGLLEAFGTGFLSPRTVITLANQYLHGLLKEGPAEARSPDDELAREVDRQTRTVLDDFNSYQPDRGRLRRVLELILLQAPESLGWTMESLERGPESGRYVDFVCRVRKGEGIVPVAFLIDVEQHHASVNAALKRGEDFLEKHPRGRVFYIRDGRCPIPDRWKAAHEKLRGLRRKGGRVLVLEPEEAARWYALALVVYSVREGGVTVEDESRRMRPVTRRELDAFVAKGLKWAAGFWGELKDSLQGDAKEPESVPSEAVSTGEEASWVSKAVEILAGTEPVTMLSAENLHEALSREGETVGLREMVSVLKRYGDRFEVLPAKDGFSVMLKKSWIHAQG